MTEENLPKIKIHGREFTATEEVVMRYANYKQTLRILEDKVEEIQHNIARIEEHFMKILIDSGEASDDEICLWRFRQTVSKSA